MVPQAYLDCAFGPSSAFLNQHSTCSRCSRRHLFLSTLSWGHLPLATLSWWHLFLATLPAQAFFDASHASMVRLEGDKNENVLLLKKQKTITTRKKRNSRTDRAHRLVPDRDVWPRIYASSACCPEQMLFHVLGAPPYYRGTLQADTGARDAGSSGAGGRRAGGRRAGGR